MLKNMKSKVMVGDVQIGADAPISIQSMCNISTQNVDGVVKQIRELEEVGCQIIRLAVPDILSAKSFYDIKKKINIPLVADIHFDYRLAIEAMKNGADKIRINPGNIGDKENVKKVVKVAKDRGIPIRIGVNGGSLEKDLIEKYGKVCADAIVESAYRHINILEEMNFSDIVLSLKASDNVLNFESYMKINQMSSYPLHIGVTEAGTYEGGVIKSSVGIGSLLMMGIGNTMRVSLTSNPVDEIRVAKKILSAVGIRKEGIEVVSCPTCGRTGVELEKIAKGIEKRLETITVKREQLNLKPLTVAVMGCEVNGPGEAKNADLGVACGKGKGAIFAKGKIIKIVREEEIEKTLIDMVENYERDF